MADWVWNALRLTLPSGNAPLRLIRKTRMHGLIEYTCILSMKMVQTLWKHSSFLDIDSLLLSIFMHCRKKSILLD